MKIGERLKILRLNKDMTLEAVGKKLSISKQTLQRYESGVIGNIPSDKIELLAEIYETTPSYIMGWNSVNETEPEIDTVAAHATSDLTKEEQQKVLEFIKFIKSQRGDND